MVLKIRSSMVGAKDRVKDSKHPVHSWNERYTTDGLGELRNCSAMAGPIHGGSAMADAVAVQNLMKLRRLTPCFSSISPTVSRSSPWLIDLSPARSNAQGSRAGAARAPPRRSHPLHWPAFPARESLRA